MISIESAIEIGKEKIKEEISRLNGPLSYEETAYHLPITYAITGQEVCDIKIAQNLFASSSDNPLIGTELIVAENETAFGVKPPYTGFLPDAIIRKLGYSLVDGSILGLALLVGTPAPGDDAAAICRELQEKLMLTFLSGGIVDHLIAEGVKVGLDLRLVPLGFRSISAVHFVDILARVALMFGGVSPGDVHRLINYASERAKAFVIAFPDLSPIEVVLIDSMRVLGIPILNTGGYTGDLWQQVTPGAAVQTGMDLRGIKVQVTAIPIPMACSPAFEGKAVRKEEMQVEFGGNRSPAFELLRVRPVSEIEDGKVLVIGDEVDSMPIGSAQPLAILIEVAGKNMKKDYEPVLERRIHNFINYGEGSWHVAQRDLIWVRITKEAVKKGLKIKHLGKLLAAKFRMDFPTFIDAVQVTLITDREKVLELKREAEAIYTERDERIAGLSDDDVSTFYSCTLCQTFAPNHVCVITPERPALCGAITWLDGQTAYEISPSGANQPIEKQDPVNLLAGEYEGVNRFVRKASHGEIDRCVLYSIIDAPMTCCGCFEAIAMVLPETNGIMVVTREYKGETPSGMSFSTLAGTIGGGAQTPGFIGISKLYLLSDKFIQAEGGIKRLVWMPSHLKEELGERLSGKLKALNISDFAKIADERDTTSIDGLQEFLSKVEHPALNMPPIL